ncbi:chitobiase/beta-hexosaminidase C-terminal domain-containing protein [Granulicella cerasi]|uniref:Chitobiase/beta-hexosaminidase C-terminal domain-containing protein n=1 Tax=Granulicella cerasi TaxID=741063 RepID=A0ABW1ZE93_9BACT|nr:chitobiase/beta-hexosaminidase C-terminal domain-containing protein [Granulicella cerasi]
MKPAVALAFLFSAVATAQFSATPGIPPEAQASMAMMAAQQQAMTIQNSAQLMAMAMNQMIGMNMQASMVFMSQMSSLHLANQQNMIFITQMSNIQHERAMLNALVRARNLSITDASKVQGVMQMASLSSSPAALKRMNGLYRTAALASGGQEAAQKNSTSSAEVSAATVASEPPPMMIRPTFGNALGVEKPTFSAEPGTVNKGTKIKLKSDTHYATLYYTTNGWTPTTHSARYRGPITINNTTHLQVMAIGPNYMRSSVEIADYEVNGTKSEPMETTTQVPTDGILRAGTPLRVSFSKELSSKEAAVGDDPAIVLDDDLKFGGKVIAPKGSKVVAELTNADQGHGLSTPGDLVFEVHGVQVGEKVVPLFGGETMEAKGGKNAIIKQGMTALAFVAADTDVK